MGHRQIPLTFAAYKTYNTKDFVVSSSNQEAYAYVKNWPQWTAKGLVVYGDSKVGKTHLSHVFRRISHAVFVQEENLEHLDQFSRFMHSGNAYIIDNVHTLLDTYQTELFHFCNLLKEYDAYSLWIGETHSSRWPIQLKDLSSRLSQFPQIGIQQPEDSLLEALLVKKISEMQVQVDDNVCQYILTHTERSAAYLISFLERINRIAFIQQRKITIPLVKEAMSLSRGN
jgi:chromosomal replication initiation ATPase DnaA